MSQDPAYLAAFGRGDDVHASVARAVFGVAVSQTKRPELREAAKAVSFGLIYGMQAHGLARRLHTSVVEAEGLIARFFASYPHLRQFLADSERTALARGYAISLSGRRLQLGPAAQGHKARGEGRDDGYLRRLARNMPIQGTGADMMKGALVAVARALAQHAASAQLVHCVHDALLVECPAEQAEHTARLVEHGMRAAAETLLPSVAGVVDVEILPHWH